MICLCSTQFGPSKLSDYVQPVFRRFHKIAKSDKLRHARPSIRTEQVSSQQTDFHESWNLIIFPKSVKKILLISARGLHVGRYPSQPVSLLWRLPYPVTRLPYGKANFESNPFSYNTPTFPNLIHSSHNHLPMKMENIECSETSAYKIQTPENNPEESIQQENSSFIKIWQEWR